MRDSAHKVRQGDAAHSVCLVLRLIVVNRGRSPDLQTMSALLPELAVCLDLRLLACHHVKFPRDPFYTLPFKSAEQ
jgi:hypothetical protein